MEIEIIFEDDALLVVNKPYGLAVHEDGHTQGPFLTDWVRAHCPQAVGVGEVMRLQNGTVIDRPGVVHRLDRDTSGVLVLAKTQEAHAFLKAQFKNRGIAKEYRAFVWGRVEHQTGTVDRPIGRSRKDFRLWSCGKDAGGQLRPAVTRYTVLRNGQWSSAGEFSGAQNDPSASTTYNLSCPQTDPPAGGQPTTSFSYLSLSPMTGRTHQLRVHLKAIGHPIVCDTRYAPNRPPVLGFTRLALHAYALTLTHPNGALMTFEAPLPEDFMRALA